MKSKPVIHRSTRSLWMTFAQEIQNRQQHSHCGEVGSQSIVHLSFMRPEYWP